MLLALMPCPSGALGWACYGAASKSCQACYTISIAWVAWMLGIDPTRNFVCVSYSNELSGKLARD